MTEKFYSGLGVELDLISKLAFACFGDLNKEEYLKQLEYRDNEKEIGTQAYFTARKLHKRLIQVFTKEEISQLIDALDIVTFKEKL